MSFSGAEKKRSSTNSILPRLTVFISNKNNKYLRCVSDDAATTGFLQFSGDDYTSPDIKFAVETATESENKGLVHIRSYYNNKYWRRSDKDSKWIVPVSDNKEEDRAQWSCTLFDPRPDGTTTLIRLLHVQLEAYLMLAPCTNSNLDACMTANLRRPYSDSMGPDVFRVTDWTSFIILPRYVSFKGDNGKYYSKTTASELLTFTGTDINDLSVRHEVVTTGAPFIFHIDGKDYDGTGSVRFKAANGFHWHGTGDHRYAIWTAEKRDESDPRILSAEFFRPVMVDNNTLALRHIVADRFFRICYNANPITAIINATSVIKEALLVMEEPVLKRIVTVNFRFNHARIYDMSPIAVASQIATNKTDVAVTATLSFSHKYSETSTWKNNFSIKASVKTTFQTAIPFLVNGHIETTFEGSYSHNFGGSITTEKTVNYQVQVNVPPKSAVKVNLMGTRGTCDIPYSYIQTDTLSDGLKVTRNLKDGSYTGVSYFDFNSVTETAEYIDNDMKVAENYIIDAVHPTKKIRHFLVAVCEFCCSSPLRRCYNLVPWFWFVLAAHLFLLLLCWKVNIF